MAGDLTQRTWLAFRTVEIVRSDYSPQVGFSTGIRRNQSPEALNFGRLGRSVAHTDVQRQSVLR